MYNVYLTNNCLNDKKFRKQKDKKRLYQEIILNQKVKDLKAKRPGLTKDVAKETSETYAEI